MNVQQRIARILQQIHEPVLRSNDGHERIGAVAVSAAAAAAVLGRDERKVGGFRFARVGAPSEHTTGAHNVSQIVRETLLEVTVVRLQLVVLDADGELFYFLKGRIKQCLPIDIPLGAAHLIHTFSCVSRVQMSATDHDSMAAEKRGSTDAVPRQVNETSFVFMILLLVWADYYARTHADRVRINHATARAHEQ